MGSIHRFKFSQLLGSVYSDGNLVFTTDGNSLICPVGNRVVVYDLLNHRSFALAHENRKNISLVALSDDGNVLVSIDGDGHALFTNFPKRVLLHQFHFKERVRAVKFSPDGQYFAIAVGKKIQVWFTPGMQREFHPFVLHRTFTGHFDDTTCIDWSPDSRFVMAGSRDQTVRVWSVNPIEGYTPPSLAGHRESIKGCFFAASGQQVYTVAKDGALFVWQKGESDIAGWTVLEKHFFKQDYAKVGSVFFQRNSNLLVVGFETGLFGLYEMPECNCVHTLSVSHRKLSAASLSPSGEWLAIGCAPLGQVLVWEWKSESYVMKQQGHSGSAKVIAYSPDGQLIASGGSDGKVKIWQAASGFCFATLTWHTGPITGLEFLPNGTAIVSASMDGTVRATDLVRYRNFRTMVSPTPVQFSCIAVDPSGEIVAAGALDSFDVFIWSLQTGRLLDVLSAHTAPVSSLSFSPNSGLLASGSWDGSVITWDVYAGKAAPERLQHSREILAVAFSPDGRQLVSATLDGCLHFWDPVNAVLQGVVEGRRDIAGGRKLGDRMTAKSSASNKHFTSVCYTANGEAVIAGGNSKYVCIYDTTERHLLRRIEVSHNRSLDGMLDMLNSKRMTDAGPADLIDDVSDSDDDARARAQLALPGVKSGDLSSRTALLAAQTNCIRASGTGDSWAAAASDGILVYSLASGIAFDPTDLEEELSISSVEAALKSESYSRALAMSLRLNEEPLVKVVIESVPVDDIAVTLDALPTPLLPSLADFVGRQLEKTQLLESSLVWAREICQRTIVGKLSQKMMPALRCLHKNLLSQYSQLTRMSDDNMGLLEYLSKERKRPQLSDQEPNLATTENSS
eukprot:tig00000076_g2387.t1